MASKVLAAPPTIRRYRVPAAVVRESVEKLRSLSGGRKEAVILWQGKAVDETTAEITRLIVPHQVTGPLHFNVPLTERLRLIGEVSKVHEFVLVQLHTHPREAYHSQADDELAITKHQGAVSVVVPYFASKWDGSFAYTSVHMNLGGAAWRELSAGEVEALFEVTP